MSKQKDDNQSLNNPGLSSSGDAAIARLLELAGQRTHAGSERRQRVFEASFGAWQQQVRGNQKRRLTRFSLALAASVVAAAVAMGVWLNLPQPVTPVQVAKVQRAEGAITVAHTDGKRHIINTNDRLTAGTLIETGLSGRASIVMSSGITLRLDHSTQLTFVAEDLLEVTQGRVYLDSHEIDRNLTLRTPFGETDHIGTQYELKVSNETLRLRVRQGQVALNATANRTVLAGTELSLNRNGITDERRISTHGPLWQWAQDIAPNYEIEGQSLSAFLNWVSREGGYQLAFADDATERAARRVVLHGSIDGSGPREALASVLPTTGFTYELREGQLVVKRQLQ